MPIPDPVPALKRQAATELARVVAGWNGDDIGAYLRTDRSRIADLRRGRLERFSLETLLRLLERAGMQSGAARDAALLRTPVAERERRTRVASVA